MEIVKPAFIGILLVWYSRLFYLTIYKDILTDGRFKLARNSYVAILVLAVYVGMISFIFAGAPYILRKWDVNEFWSLYLIMVAVGLFALFKKVSEWIRIAIKMRESIYPEDAMNELLRNPRAKDED